MQRARCPKQLFVLTGYSEGAMVVVQALNNDALPYDAISGVVLFGSPYWRSWNRESAGSATVGAGCARLSLVMLTNIEADALRWQCGILRDLDTAKLRRQDAGLLHAARPHLLGPAGRDACQLRGACAVGERHACRRRSSSRTHHRAARSRRRPSALQRKSCARRSPPERRGADGAS